MKTFGKTNLPTLQSLRDERRFGTIQLYAADFWRLPAHTLSEIFSRFFPVRAEFQYERETFVITGYSACFATSDASRTADEYLIILQGVYDDTNSELVDVKFVGFKKVYPLKTFEPQADS